MWKQPEEITAHNQSKGRPERFDPAQWIHTLVVEVETVWLEGDDVVLAGCCESVRARRADVIAWRELPGSEGNPSTYEVRLREGADVIAQRAAKASRQQPECPRCGRSWGGLPPARGPRDGSPDRGDHDGRDGGRRDEREGGCCGEGGGEGCCGGGERRGGGGCCGEGERRGGEEHSHHGGEHGPHDHSLGGADHHLWHHAHKLPHHHHGADHDDGTHHHHEDHGPHDHE